MSRLSAIETHPQRVEVINALMSGQSSRTIAGWITPRVSHNAIHRYMRDTVRPAISAQPNQKSLKTVTDQTLADVRGRATETRQRLAVDPVLQRINAKFKRLDGAIAKSLEEENLDAYAKLEGADSKAVELLAKATMHPGFVATASHQTEVTVNTIVVMPNPDLCNGSVSGVSSSVTARSSQVGDIDISPL